MLFLNYSSKDYMCEGKTSHMYALKWFGFHWKNIVEKIQKMFVCYSIIHLFLALYSIQLCEV